MEGLGVESEHAGMATTSDRPLPVPPEKYILLFEQCLFCGAKKNHKSKRIFRRRPEKEDIPKHMKVLYTRPVVELADTFKVARHFTLDEPENLTEEWLEEMMGIVRK